MGSGAPFDPGGAQLKQVGSYGHTGFTGTMLWVDPSSATYVIILIEPNVSQRCRRCRTSSPADPESYFASTRISQGCFYDTYLYAPVTGSPG